MRDHILKLQEWGLPAQSIASAAKCSNTTISYIVQGRTHTSVLLYVANGIMAVSHRPMASQPKVLSVGAKRRIEALQAAGFSHDDITAHMRHNSSKNVLPSGATILFDTWLCVKEAYDELSTRPVRNNQVAKRARCKGWFTPLDWESVDIDHPDSFPEVVEVKPRNAVEVRSAGREMLRSGKYRRDDIAKKLNVSRRTVDRWGADLGRADGG